MIFAIAWRTIAKTPLVFHPGGKTRVSTHGDGGIPENHCVVDAGIDNLS